ncbi:MAG TPA: ATP-binding protein [Ramlibacter sp.]|nr:ATP-binding protein [Ramlibacter sp.]
MAGSNPLPPDLSSCATEPIHIPGSVQPHGVLLAVERSGKVVQASNNAGSLLMRTAVCGEPLQGLLDPGASEQLLAALHRGQSFQGSVRGGDGSSLFATCHWVGELAVVELERASDGFEFAPTLEAAIVALATAEDAEAVVQTCSTQMRRLSGFDRVMIYRFDEDGHGQVIAEDCHSEVDPYLGHHYPESDIPRQARALYLRNWIRCIPDAGYRPVPVVPTLRPDTGEPLDLSGSHLRSVSPVHLEYLANMGIRASMSVSLIVEGRLWGLISCGHRMPKPMPAGLRQAAETIGRLLSLRLGALQATEFQRRKEAAAGDMASLYDTMRANSARLLPSLTGALPELLGLVGATGAAVVEGQSVVLAGTCPSSEVVLALAAHAQPYMVEGFFCTRQLPRDVPLFAGAAASASGVMAISLPPGDRTLMWFRPEVPHTVLWGGDPSKSAEAEAVDGRIRLHPRQSFAVWKEEIRGKSLPWQPVERHLAQELRRHAVEIDLGVQVESHKAAVRARDELVAVVSHDLRTPVSIVAMQAALIQRFVGTDPGEASKRLATSALVVRQAADRMTAMLRDLLDLSRIEAGRFDVQPSPQAAGQLIEEACELMRHLADARGLHIVTEPPPSMDVEADPERIFHVFANLIGNAIKFTPSGGTITVGAALREGRCEFFVKDTGRGIAAERLEQVFGRYWQERADHDAAGLGLGLYICQGIIEAHAGRIWVESVPGLGSTFKFQLPLAAPPDGARKA